MENKIETSQIGDLLIPRKTEAVKEGEVKVIKNEDGLLERSHKKIVTTDGRQLLK